MANNGDDPWDYLTERDVARFGPEILDKDLRAKWAAAMSLAGSLGYMWRKKAAVVREMIYDKLELRAGDKVLIIGEAVDTCGFDTDIEARVGEAGEVTVIDIIEKARDMTLAKERGRSGRIGSWKWDYTNATADEYYDCVAVLQSVQHADDWREIGAELLRVMKPGRRIALTEICLGEPFQAKIETDVHFSFIFDRLGAAMGVHLGELSNYSPQEILDAFDGLVEEPQTFQWKGIETFWGRKP
jgi:ubiquinone/menaquinone biosynthesis C-methylase UbiE